MEVPPLPPKAPPPALYPHAGFLFRREFISFPKAIQAISFSWALMVSGLRHNTFCTHQSVHIYSPLQTALVPRVG
eukprot:4986701-Amphidinium_carterae.1